MRINALWKKLNISVRTIRYYEELGLLTSSRNDNSIREFDAFQIERLELILFFKNFNFSLHAIKQLLLNLDTNTIKSLFKNRIRRESYSNSRQVNSRICRYYSRLVKFYYSTYFIKRY